MRKAQSKCPVVQYDLNGTVIATYPSQTEAQRQTAVPQSNIYKSCKRKLRSAGGFVWRYEDDHFDPKLPYIHTTEHRQHMREAALRRTHR